MTLFDLEKWYWALKTNLVQVLILKSKAQVKSVITAPILLSSNAYIYTLYLINNPHMIIFPCVWTG